MFKEEFCSIAYEVVCNCRKFIPSVSVGHSAGIRNNKHIVRTDSTVMQLLEGNGWLRNSKSWITSAVNGTRKFIGASTSFAMADTFVGHAL